MRNPPIPTRKEIAAECRLIQAGWSPAERESRRIGWTHFRFSTAGVETAARAAVAKRLERRRGAMEALSLIAAMRRHAEAQGLIERVEPDEPGGDVFEIGWSLAEEER